MQCEHAGANVDMHDVLFIRHRVGHATFVWARMEACSEHRSRSKQASQAVPPVATLQFALMPALCTWQLDYAHVRAKAFVKCKGDHGAANASICCQCCNAIITNSYCTPVSAMVTE